MIKQILNICMVLLLPPIVVQLLVLIFFKIEFNWEYMYLMTLYTLVTSIILIRKHEINEKGKKQTRFNYVASVRSGPMIFLLVIFVFNTSVTVSGLEKEALVIRIVAIVAIIILAFVRFKFYIEENTLTYEIMLFTILLYKRRVFPDDIKHVKFVRTGWAKKAAIIKVKKGINLRIINFEPTHVCPDLNKFTDKHSISISKTNDYILLDKSSRQSALKGKEEV
ncbi:hypothetical protein [Lysinibacillus sp. SGAir0095]|uniref:hypothetical protein n=1 Tax=Lysinibacillus sp. SGAir0095 TaxID=2070463 RepID=UPI0010CD1222|nr:hypothetical protein [Lysinibacillus sp. SGAir0095]QCR31192.1 hypothetical protein C1N55_03025 [Lysinibacillus sp. SGAir0095]